MISPALSVAASSSASLPATEAIAGDSDLTRSPVQSGSVHEGGTTRRQTPAPEPHKGCSVAVSREKHSQRRRGLRQVALAGEAEYRYR